MPEQATYPPGAELWAPLTWNTSDWASHDSNLLHVIGRLHPNESRQRALAELRTLTGNQVPDLPREPAKNTLVARPLREEIMLGDLVMLGFAGGVAGFVLLLVCANVANLQLTHGLARRHELAVRAALGAGRRRLFGQMLAESLMLGLLGGGLGLLLAMWAIPLVKLHLSTELGLPPDQLEAVSLSHRALGFTTALSLLVGIVTGLFPAWSVSRSDLINTLKEGGRQTAGDHRGQRFRRGLVITQIALAVGLLTGAGVFLHAFQLGVRFEPGMDLDRVLAFQVHPSGPLYAHPGQRQDFQARSLEILAAIPGVETVAVADGLPVGSPPRRTLVELEPDAEGTRTAAISVSRHGVDAHYFETLGIPLRRGRGFTATDRVEAPQVAIVSETFAKSLPEGINPVGLRLRLLNEGEDPQSVTIVGLVADVQGDPWSWAPRDIYLPLPPGHAGNQAFLLRTMLTPDSLKAAVRNGLRELNPLLPVPGLESLRTVVRRGMGAIPMLAPLLGALVVLGLGLSGLGVYGVIAQNVAARTSEIGIRLALGSSRFAVFRLVLVHGLRMTLWGLAIGLPLAFLLAWGIGSQVLDRVSAPHIAFGIVGATLVAITLAAGLACWFPARQAMRLDPLQALRSE
jgi:putative ABC transport system permease protein